MDTYTKIPYDDSRDFLRVRDLLVDTCLRTGEARNWMIDRWEFCRAFAHTLVGTAEGWPSTVGLWIDSRGKIAAVAASEGEGRGEAHFLLDLPEGPVPAALIEELFDHVEGRLTVSIPGQPCLKVRIWEGYPELEAEAVHRGLNRVWTEAMSHKTIRPAEGPVLPDGYRLAWGTQVDDEAKGRVHARAFGYEDDPLAALAGAGWAALRTMPDWRSDFELFALAPDGTVASFVNLWVDTKNRLAVCEPVGTDPAHRNRGLARSLMAEGGRRAASLGARELLVGTDTAFYRACGFTPRERHRVWER